MAWSRSSGFATGVRRVWKSMTCAAFPTVTRSVLPPVLPSAVPSAAPGVMTASRSVSQRGWVNAPAHVTTALAALAVRVGSTDRSQSTRDRPPGEGTPRVSSSVTRRTRSTSRWCWTRPSWVTHSSRSVSCRLVACRSGSLVIPAANVGASRPGTAVKLAQFSSSGNANPRLPAVSPGGGPAGAGSAASGLGVDQNPGPARHRWRAGPTRGRPACAGASREANPSCPWSDSRGHHRQWPPHGTALCTTELATRLKSVCSRI